MWIFAAALFAAGSIWGPETVRSQPNDPAIVGAELLLGGVEVAKIAPDPRGGKAYRLRYVVDVPLEVYWRFKTDFDNAFLLDNKYIDDHRVLEQNETVVVTEDRYSHAPGAVFRWKTTPDKKNGRIDFVLLNPEQCGQRFHHGRIQVIGIGEKTLVVQEGFFDFFGAAVWAHYPWAGGMRHFLQYTARWEQNTVLRMRRIYDK
ncbi:MAG: hypothetical protein PVG78_16295 [Desulfobacterales bacterium]|jgi:hypothetical protein